MQNIGEIAFAVALLIMLISAGVASLPPARSYRVLIGAIVLACAWAIMLLIQVHYNSASISSKFFIFDIFYTVVFFLLSIPEKKEGVVEANKHDWAGHVVAIFAIMIVMQIIHFLSVQEFYMKPAVIGLCVLISFLFFFGFARGFGWKATIYFTALFILVNLASVWYYTETANALTLLVIVLITRAGIKSSLQNFSHWSKSKRLSN